MKIETPILRRLGPVPFWRGEGKCLDELEKLYRKAIESARSAGARLPDDSRPVASREGRRPD